MKTIKLLFVLLILMGCSSDDPSPAYDEDPILQDPQDPDPDPDGQDPALADNVVSIQDDKSQVVSTESDLTNGIYIIEFSETPPKIEINDIIVGGEGYGFIRKVNSVTPEGNTVTMSTTQASLKDVFKYGTIEFTTNPAGSSRKSSAGKSNYLNKGEAFKEDYSYDLSDLYYGPNFTFTKGKASFNPSLGPIVVQYDNSQVRELDFKDNNIVLTSELEFVIESGGPEDYENVINFDPIEIEYPQEILGLEFKLVITIEPVIDFSLFVDDAFKATGGVTNIAEVSLVAENNNATWNSNDSYNVDTSSTSVNMEQPANVQQHFTFIARLSAQVNLLPALYFQADLSEDFYVNFEEETGDWDSGLSAGLDFNYGIYGEIFGIEYDFSDPLYNYHELLWYAPDNLEIESGDNQTGVYYGESGNPPLADPLKVLVYDSDGMPLPNVHVHYEVVKGGGSVDIPDVFTDGSGFAETSWTLGNESEVQTVEVTIKKENGDLIGDSPLEFHATLIDLSGTWIIENTSSNCPEDVYYRFSFNPPNNSLDIDEDGTEEITSTGYDFDLGNMSISMSITSSEEFEYTCDLDGIYYITEDVGVATLNGQYSNGEFTGSYTVCFTETPINPCVNNFCCTDSFRMYKE